MRTHIYSDEYNIIKKIIMGAKNESDNRKIYKKTSL